MVPLALKMKNRLCNIAHVHVDPGKYLKTRGTASDMFTTNQSLIGPLPELVDEKLKLICSGVGSTTPSAEFHVETEDNPVLLEKIPVPNELCDNSNDDVPTPFLSPLHVFKEMSNNNLNNDKDIKERPRQATQSTRPLKPVFAMTRCSPEWEMAETALQSH